MFKIKLLCCSVIAGAASLGAPAGTTFTYQGQVKIDGLPLEGVADFRISLWNDPVSSLTSPTVQEKLNVNVSNGLFAVELDFGSSPFSDARWLGVEVRFPAGSGNYQLLSPRQPVTAAPLALHALNAPSSGGGPWAANGNDIYKTNSGNVGIGTTTPLQALHVVGRILAQTSGIAIQGTKQGTGTFPGVHGETESTSADASGTRGYVLSTTPGARSAGLWGRNFGTTANGYGIRGSHDGSGAGIYGEAANANGFGGYFDGRGYFSGSLGLGNSNPTYPLDVTANAQAQGIRSTGTVFISKPLSSDGAGLTVSRVTASNPISISQRTEIDGNRIDAYSTFSASGTSLRLNSNSGGNILLAEGGGAVSIGSSTIPTGVRLAVQGKVLAEEVEVQLSTNWPDYVFADDYQLMPLDELETRIRTDRRLPGIPPATEMESQGLAVGAMQVKMMEKLEELTLYVISINRELEEVKCRNAELERELAALQQARVSD